ncbi:MAG: DNA replication complex GINS family protein [Candidatus Aenigmarchaeota archaeon]|nr:DNA replication complex GINS family protein [Candidatus Aenigmarchaeota archaeon]
MLTFDKIRDMERLERQSRKLQKVPDDLVAELRDYINRKEKGDKSSADLIEMENIKATIKRFFELREGKILTSVLDTVRTGLPPENMNKSEEALFYRLTNDLKRHREEFFSELGKEEKKPLYMYRVKKTLPPFVGPDMKTYLIKENDIVNIPAPLDEFLLKEGIIEKAS